MSEINEHLRGPWLAVLADRDGLVYPTFDEARKYLPDDAEMLISVVRGTALPEDVPDSEELQVATLYDVGDLIFEIDAYLIDEDDVSVGAEARYAQAQAMADGLNAAAPLGELVADGGDRG